MSPSAREVVLRNGFRIVGSSDHFVLAAAEGGPLWRRLDEVTRSDFIAYQLGRDVWSPTMPTFSDFVAARAYGAQKVVRIPQVLTTELAFLLGAYASEGHTTRSNWTVTITNACDAVLERVAAAWWSEFGVVARITRERDRCPGVLIASKSVVEFLDYLGAGSRASNKRVPAAIMRAPREAVLSFLQGLALDAYVTVSTAPKWAICVDSPLLLDDVQMLLANFGVMSGRVGKYNREYDKTFGEVYATGEYAQLLARLVPFMEPEKAGRANDLIARAFKVVHATADVVPGITPRALFDLLPAHARGGFRFLCDPRTRYATRHSVLRVANVAGIELPSWLALVLDAGLHFAPVTSVGQPINVPSTSLSIHCYAVPNSIVNAPACFDGTDWARRRSA